MKVNDRKLRNELIKQTFKKQEIYEWWMLIMKKFLI